MVVILACDGFGEILTSDPVSDLRRLKILRVIFKSPEEMGGERYYALKFKNGDARDRKSLRMRRRAMKKCRILGLGTGWIFFIAQPKSLIGLLAVKGVSASDMEESQLIRLLGRKGGGEP